MSEIEPTLDLKSPPDIPLPKGWTNLTLQAILHAITMARIVILNSSIWPDGPECDTLRLRAENDRLKSEIALLQAEISIKDARFSRLEPKKRPHYLPAERLQILVIQAARGLTNIQIAHRFSVTFQTIRNWIKGKDDNGKVVQPPEKPTRYPDFVRYTLNG